MKTCHVGWGIDVFFFCFRKQKLEGGYILAQKEKNTANNSGCSIQERALNAVNCALAEGVKERDWPPSLWGPLSSDLLWIVLPVTACQHGRPHIPDVESAVLSNSSSITDAVLLLDSWERFNVFDSLLSLGPHTFTSRMFLDMLLILYLHGYHDSPSLPNPMWTEVIGFLISLESKPGLLIL